LNFDQLPSLVIECRARFRAVDQRAWAQHFAGGKPLTKSLGGFAVPGGQGKQIAIKGDDVRGGPGDCELDKHRVMRVARELELRPDDAVLGSVSKQ